MDYKSNYWVLTSYCTMFNFYGPIFFGNFRASGEKWGFKICESTLDSLVWQCCRRLCLSVQDGQRCEVSQRIHHVWYCLMVKSTRDIHIYIYHISRTYPDISRIYPDISRYIQNLPRYIQIYDDNPAIFGTSRQFCKVILAGLVAFTFYLGSSMGFRKRQHRRDFLLELSRLSWANGAGTLEAMERPGVMGILYNIPSGYLT